MYLVGQPHRHKVDAQRRLERCLAERERLVTDAEAFREILHRYAAIQRRDAIQPAFDLLPGLVDEVFPITVEDVQRAREIVVGVVPLSARDAIHVAVMERNGIGRICRSIGASTRSPRSNASPTEGQRQRDATPTPSAAPTA